MLLGRKQCAKCLTLKPQSEFSLYKPGGSRRRICKACRASQSAAGYRATKSDPEKLNRKREQGRKSVAKWRDAHPEAVLAERVKNRSKASERAYQKKVADLAAYLVKSARERAARKGLPFDLVASDVVVPERCPVLGLTLLVSRGRRGGGDSSPTLDRLIPALGYVRGNVSVISNRANTLKRDATVEELEAVVRWMKSML